MKEFISQFTGKQLFDEKDVRKIGHDYFLVSAELAKRIKTTIQPQHIGLYLGKLTEKSARPSLELLQMLAKTEAKKATVNSKGAWLFICKRPALKESILKVDAQPNELVLVINERKECLGYGLFTGPEIKNYFDIGDFLRRERRAKRF